MERITEHWKNKARAKDFRVTVVAPEERHQVINRCKDIITSNQGRYLRFQNV